MKAKEINGKAQYYDLLELQDAEIWSAFRWQGNTSLRTVPSTINGSETPCRNCHFEKLKATRMICPGMPVCCAHKRRDKISVKFISADLNCITDERKREMAQMADLKNRW